jgi:hypothetical protein
MAIIQHLSIDQNSTFSAEVAIRDSNQNYFNLTDYTAYAQMRKSPTSTTVISSFTCSIPTPEYGTVVLQLTDEQTALIKPGRYLYDVIIEDDAGQIFRAIEGIITVNAGITTIPAP